MVASGFRGWRPGGVWAAVVALALQACGGGGGGGVEAPEPAGPDRNSPLRPEAGNFAAVSSQGLRSVESLLRWGQFAAGEVALLARNGTLQLEFGCLDRGSARYTLVDVDGNGMPSAGDSLRITYDRCYLGALAAEYEGTIVIQLTTVDDALHGAVSGRLDFGSGFAPFDGSLVTWRGTLDFRRSETALQEALTVSATAANELRRSVRVQSATRTVEQVDAYPQAQLERVIEREAARIGVTGSLVLASDRLGGRLDITLAPQMSAYLDTHADSGNVRINGASNTRITLLASAAGSATLQAELDSNGDGVTDASSPFDWNSIFDGFLWSERNFALMPTLVARNDSYLRLLSQPDFNQLRGVDLSRPLRLQFDRPLSPATLLQARLVDLGSSLDALYGVRDNALSDVRPVIETDVLLRGAVILVQPREPLRYGHSYQLLVSNTGDFLNAQAVTLRNVSGSAELNVNVQLAGFNSDDMLWAAVSGAGNRSVVMPGRASTISANVPRATSLPLRYQWAQLSGPSLVLDSPQGASTVVRLADGATPGIARAVLQLTVTDAIGRRSITHVEMQVANLSGVNPILYFASSDGDFIGAGQTRVYSVQAGSFDTDTTRGYLTVRYDDLDPAVHWNFELSAAGGGLPVVGTYTGAVGVGHPVGDAPGLNFNGSGRACFPSAGSFQLLEIEVDSLGQLQRLAVDFEQTCLQSNTPAPIRGSVRINSSLPIRP
jgi:hypothetical protein